mmetsp:Transcript_36400/g.109276  ORF Transcript_36400/g.109276 Transcript_36400/m.109276 type:complete len:248 (-) Transcript_36400:447-1190(-)
MSVGEQILYQFTIGPSHTGVMNGQTVRKYLLQIRVFHRRQFLPQYLLGRSALPHEMRQFVPFQRHIPQRHGRLPRLLPAVHENEHLIAIPPLSQGAFVAHFVLNTKALERIPFGNTDVLHLEGYRAIRMIEEEETLVGFDAQECRDVGIIGQGGGQSDQTDGFGGRFDLTYYAGDDRFQYRASIVVQQMDLVHNDESDQLSVRPPFALTGDNVPFFGGGDEELRLGDLLTGEAGISRQFANIHSVGR